ncbi:sulfite oxidase [Dentipellis sp. KUC8613]|nr:sulfite oxidase [Dentipellis sp. KUC8613]
MSYESHQPHYASVFLDVKKLEPLNAEPDVAALIEFPHTPDELTYCRNHGPITVLDEETFTIKIDGEVRNELKFTLDELRRSFPHASIVAAMQCAGNRRSTMSHKKGRDTEGIPWGEGVISNLRWTGVRMCDVLLAAGLTQDVQQSPDGMHVCFCSHVAPCEDAAFFGGSIPLAKALDRDGDVLIAYEMNGHPLSPAHGFPFRIVVPGYSGERWVKWVDHITVSRHESANYYQQKDYKVLPSSVTTHAQADSESWWTKVPPLEANTLNSVIATARIIPPGSPPESPTPPASVTIAAKGYALGGAAARIARVALSADRGASWVRAHITYQEGRWSWALWEAIVVARVPQPPPPGTRVVLWCRATDEDGVSQVYGEESEWNLRGVAYSAVGEYEIEL